VIDLDDAEFPDDLTDEALDRPSMPSATDFTYCQGGCWFSLAGYPGE